MLGYLAVFMTGGLAGTLTVALLVAAKDRYAQSTDDTHTANQAHGPSSWAIAHNGAITTESQLGKFSVTTRRGYLAGRP